MKSLGMFLLGVSARVGVARRSLPFLKAGQHARTGLVLLRAIACVLALIRAPERSAT